jgi:hypothetical protein
MSGVKRVMNEEYLAKVSATWTARCFCPCFDKFKSADTHLGIDAVLAGNGTS